MERPNKNRLQADAIKTHESTSESTTATTRTIDLSIGLVLKREDGQVVKQAFSSMDDRRSKPQPITELRQIHRSPYRYRAQRAQFQPQGEGPIGHLESWSISQDVVAPMGYHDANAGYYGRWKCREFFLFFVWDSRLVSILLH